MKKHELEDRLIDYYNKVSSDKSRWIRDKLPSGHVIDEDKSIKWNKEEVDKRNDLVEATWKRDCENAKGIINNLLVDIFEYYKDEYEFLTTYEQFENIWERATYYYEGSCVNIFDEFEHRAEFIEEIYKLGRY